MQESRCADCRYWTGDEPSYRAIPNIGECRKVVMLWDATHWDCETHERALLPEHRNQMSFVQDGSDYSASLWTMPEFFCAHHEKRD